MDHTPQCWYGGLPNSRLKPSCELADLLFVIWDDSREISGRALLIQGKKGKTHSKILTSESSTKKEINLLSDAPDFLLSNQMSVIKGAHPNAFSALADCEFKLNQYSGARLDHCTFLQIRDAKARRWPQNLYSSWQTMWPPGAHAESLDSVLIEMVRKTSGALGKPFQRSLKGNDWDRLVTLLIDQTLRSAKGTAKGSLINHVNFQGVGGMVSGGGIINNDFEDSEEPGGISTILITPNYE